MQYSTYALFILSSQYGKAMAESIFSFSVILNDKQKFDEWLVEVGLVEAEKRCGQCSEVMKFNALKRRISRGGVRKDSYGLHFAEFLWMRKNKEARFQNLVKALTNYKF